MKYHQIYHQYIIIQLNMTQSIFTGLLYDSCLKPGPVEILEDKQSSQRVMAFALSEIVPMGCKFQMNREDWNQFSFKFKLCTKKRSMHQIHLQKNIALHINVLTFLCFGSKPATLPLHIARSQPVQSNCCQCDVKGSSLAKGKSTNKSSAGSNLPHVLFWISSFSNLWYHLTGFLGETIILHIILINLASCSASTVSKTLHKIPNLQAIWDWICLPWWPNTGSLTNGDKLSAHTTTFETKFAPGLYLSVGSIDDASECRVLVLHVFLVLLKRYDNYLISN